MKETLSAWMDSELDGHQAAALLPQLKREPELRRDWDCYHLIGDALRGVHGPDLCARICARLDAEPTVLAPQRRGKAEKLRWTALSLAASVAAAAFVGWMALSGTQPDAVQIAAVPAPAVLPVAVPAGDAINDYLLAHQRYSPSNAMQGVAPYVRTVAEERGGLRQ
jgi:sigma-E factor negative regulatory protein RseA